MDHSRVGGARAGGRWFKKKPPQGRIETAELGVHEEAKVSTTTPLTRTYRYSREA